MNGHSIRTHSGLEIDYLNLASNVYAINDIAQGLSSAPRFVGQCNIFYSVALHSVITSYLSPDEQSLEGLLHDATEAYMCDLPTPLKRLMPRYQEMEAEMDSAIRSQYGLPSIMSHGVKEADEKALSLEKPILFGDLTSGDEPVNCTIGLVKLMSQRGAKKLFLDRYNYLMGQGDYDPVLDTLAILKP